MDGYVAPPFEIPTSLMDDLTKLGSLLDAGKAAQELGQNIFQQFLCGNPVDTALKLVACVLFGKAFKTLQAIHNLCLIGCGSDALALCGSLFENYVDLRCMRQAPVLRPKQHIQYELVEKYYRAQRILKRKRLPRGLRKTFKKYEKELHPQVINLLRHFPDRSKGWLKEP